MAFLTKRITSAAGIELMQRMNQCAQPAADLMVF